MMKKIMMLIFIFSFGSKSSALLSQNPQKGFNELLITAHLKFIGQWNLSYSQVCRTEPYCPDQTATMYAGVSSSLLYNIYLNQGEGIYRDILPLKVIEPVLGGFNQLESEIAFAIKEIYQRNNATLILAFGKPYPNWFEQELAAQISANPQLSKLDVEAKIVSEIIGRFLARLRYNYANVVSAQWMAGKLRVEPLNEVNTINGDPRFHAQIDRNVKNKIAEYNIVVKDVVSSSIVSSTNWQYLDWYWRYYQQGGVGTPNVHFYYEPGLDADFRAAIARFENVMFWLRRHAHATFKEVIIGEIGISAKGIPGNPNWSEYEHDNFFSTINNSPSLSEGSPILFWQLFKNYLPFPTLNESCRTTPCADEQAMNSTFGFVDARQNSFDSQFGTYFIKYGFWWNPRQ